MDQEVAKTLGELELKLRELERELTTVGRQDKSPQPGEATTEIGNTPGRPPVVGGALEGTPEGHAAGRLIDEAAERHGGVDAETSAEDQAIADGAGFGGAPIFGGEEVPAQAGATERDRTVEVRETAYGEIPTTPTPTPPPLPPPLAPAPTEHRSIDVAELVQFKAKMQRTMEELIYEYSRMTSPKPPA